MPANVDRGARGGASSQATRRPKRHMLTTTVLAIAALYFVIPLIWLLLAPTKTNRQLLDAFPLSIGSIGHAFEALANLWTYSANNGLVFVWAGNSLWYGLAIVAGVIALSIPAGYVLAMFRFRGRRLLLILTLLATFMPSSALVLPIFLELNAAHVLGTPLAVILPLAFYPFGTFLAYTFFATTIPRDLLAAARIDGCSELRTFVSVVLPNARTVVAIVSLFAFIRAWNEFFLPYLTLSDPNLLTLPVGLANLIGGTGALVPAGPASHNWPIGRPEVALAGLVQLVPIVLLFLAAQRVLRAGIIAGFERAD